MVSCQELRIADYSWGWWQSRKSIGDTLARSTSGLDTPGRDDQMIQLVSCYQISTGGALSRNCSQELVALTSFVQLRDSR